MKKVGIIREGKRPIDRRVPLTPEQVLEVQKIFPDITVVCQPSPHRCFTDQEYSDLGISLQEDLSDCDIILGVKEIPLEDLMEEKTYLFFSHTIKEQPYNQQLLRTVLDRNIRLIDYELLSNGDGKRVVAFGRYAGLVGAYNAIWTYGKRYNLFHLKRAYQCHDLKELKAEFSKVKLPPVRIVITGGGRVSKGAMEILYGMGIRKVSPRDLRKKPFKRPVFTQLNARDYYEQSEGGEFSRREFYTHPERYRSIFTKYTKVADILIAGAYWDPRADRLFERSDMLKHNFHLSVVADITCDIDGSIPSTKRASTIDDPVYDYNPSDDHLEEAFTDEGNVTVMAIDNLPCELPRDASNDFGHDLIEHCFPNLFIDDENGMIENATITEKGELTPKFSYLHAYANGELKNHNA